MERELYRGELLRLANEVLPQPAVGHARPGVGFVICHQGRGWHYLVLGWWDNENELPLRVFVRPRDATPTEPFRPARGSESICVWDLEVIAFERNQYVRHVLGAPDGATDGVARYLAAALCGSTAAL